MNSMTFQKEGDYVVCYINGKEVNRSKLANTGSSEEEIIDVIDDQIKANPTLEGDEPDLEGLKASVNRL